MKFLGAKKSKKAGENPEKKPKRVKKEHKTWFRWWLVPAFLVAAFTMTIAILMQIHVRPPEQNPWDDNYIGWYLDSPPPSGTSPTPPPGVKIDAKRKEGVTTFLFVGVDKGGGNTDTLMVASLDEKNQKASLISIPRDTWVKRSQFRINASYATKNGGYNQLLDDLSTIIGFRPDHVVRIDLNGFVEIVDAVGGVDFNVPKRLYYRDPTQGLYIDLQKGMQHLDGKKAIQLMRYRSGYATADLQRTSVQRDFLRALAKKVMTPDGVLRVVPKLESVVTKNLETRLTWGNMTYYALQLSKIDMEADFITDMIPVVNYTHKGASMVKLVPDKTLEIINATINPYKEDLTLDDITSY